MRLLISPMILCGCGLFDPTPPPPPKDSQSFELSIKNEYAESIFNSTISVVSPTGGGTVSGSGMVVGSAVRVFDMQRIAAYDTKTAATIEVQKGADVEVAVSAESLGQWHNFSPIHLSPAKYPTYKITYDYDLATAAFMIHFPPP